jgi:predicted aminopeptidase
MSIDHPDDTERSFEEDRRPYWSDIERMRELREFIASTRARLKELRTDPIRNLERIAYEEAVLSSTEEELRKIEARVFMG